MSLRPLIENSAAALPAFVMVDDVLRPGRSTELDVLWSHQGWIEPAEGEEILGRWLCLKMTCHVAMGENDGLPSSLTRDDVRVLTPLFEGAGLLVLTSRRIVGSIGHGATALGAVGREGALLYTLPLEVFEQLDVLRRKAWSGLKETGLMAWIAGGGFLFAVLDRVVDEQRRARSSSRVEAAHLIVSAVAAVQRPSATPDQAALLERALAGNWRAGEDDDLEIELAPVHKGVLEPESQDESSPAPTDEPTAPDPSTEAGVASPEDEESELAAAPATTADAVADDGWRCRSCDAPNVAAHRFCTNCGTERGATPAAAGLDEELDPDEAPAASVGCELCDCEAPGEGDRFCRACGHPADAHGTGVSFVLGPARDVHDVAAVGAAAASVEETLVADSGEDEAEDLDSGAQDSGVMDAGESSAPALEGSSEEAAETDAPASPATCWSCDRAIPEDGAFECPHCGVSLDRTWNEPTRVQVPVGAALGVDPVGHTQEERPSEESSQDRAPLVNVDAIGPAQVAPPPKAAEPHVGGWGVAVFLFGVIGGFVGWLTLRSSNPRRANHVLKWGAIWSAFFFLVTPIVTYLVLFAALKSLADSSEAFDTTTDYYEQTTDYGYTDTDPYMTTGSDATTETDPDSSVPTATALLGAPLVERQLALSTSDGYTGDLTVRVYDVFRASDFPPLPLTYRDTIASCDADPTTDAVIPVSVRLENTSPAGFDATPLALKLYAGDGIVPLLPTGDVRYSDHDACLGRLTGSSDVVYDTYWESAAGSVSDDFYLILHDYYSPSAPDGDRARLEGLELLATVAFGPSGSQSFAGSDEGVPVIDGGQTSPSGSTATPPSLPPPAPATTTQRTTVFLTERLIAPTSPYRCASPSARDHSGRMELELRYASGPARAWVSEAPSDTADSFLFCGGSVTYGLPGFASAPLRFQDPGSVSRIVSVRGILGADRDEGASGRRVALTISYNGEQVCHVATDAVGHARRFSCRGFPASSSLSGLELRLDVGGDRRLGVFAGIAELEATVEED